MRTLIAKLPAGLLVLAAAFGFWTLSHGMSVGPAAIYGYAEEQVHAVAPLQTGRLQEVVKQIGKPVHAGDIVARLDTRPLDLQRQRLAAELEQAKAELQAAQDLQESSIQRGQLQAVRSSAAQKKAEAELKELNQQLKRLKPLGAEHLVRANEVEAVRQKQKAVAADLLARTLGTPREQELMGLRPRSQTEQESRLQQRLQPFRAALEVKQAALREIDFLISGMTLRAPVDGTVSAILQFPGNVVTAGTPVVTVSTMRPGHVVAFLPERRARTLDLGATVRLRRMGSFGTGLRGQVVEVAPMLEEVPLRLRATPSVVMWARRVVIQLEGSVPLLPGEAFRVNLR